MKIPQIHSAKVHQDLIWIEEYKNSDNLEALGQLYQPYMSLVYGVALKYFRDQDKSKDAVMQVFELLIEKVKSHEISNFKSWLYVLSKNYCLMQLRKENKQTIVPLDAEIVESSLFLHHEDRETRETKLKALENCIDRLEDKQKQSIHLFYLEQKCYTEVAELTGFELKKVKSYIQNGKRNLKICIEDQGE